MVQTHPSHRLRGMPAHYWKVQAGNISNDEYRRRLRRHLPKRYPKNTRLKFPAIDSRAQRGMLLYEKCTAVELLTFCNQRGIDAASTPLIKANLINLLQTVDESTVFESFDKLPPELRLSIYGFSFQFFDQRSLPPTARILDHESALPPPGGINDRAQNNTFTLPPPPIASVNRLLRNESLPLFYESDILVLHTRRMWENNITSSTFKVFERWENAPRLLRAPVHLMSLIRKATFYVNISNRRYNSSGEALAGPAYFTRQVEVRLRADGGLEQLKLSPARVPTLDDTMNEEFEEGDALQEFVSQFSEDKWLEQVWSVCQNSEHKN